MGEIGVFVESGKVFLADIQIEKHENAEVNSRWYELIVDLVSRDSVEQDWCHTVYLLVSLN